MKCVNRAAERRPDFIELVKFAATRMSQIALYHAGVNVTLIQHSLSHNTPDACFPNNWFSTHTAAETKAADLVLYPMKCANRAAERRPDLIELLKARGYKKCYDMTARPNAMTEEKSSYLEGTGSLVLDRVKRVAYVSLSERADIAAAEKCDP
jgi:hypothetical protein